MSEKAKQKILKAPKELTDKIARLREQQTQIEEQLNGVNEQIAAIDKWMEDNPPPKQFSSEWARTFRNKRNAKNTLKNNASSLRIAKINIDDAIKQLKVNYDKAQEKITGADKVLWGHQRKDYESKLESQKLVKVRAKAAPTLELLRLGSKDFFGKVANQITKDNVEELKTVISQWDNKPEAWAKKFPGVRHPQSEIEAAKKRLWEFESFQKGSN